MALEILFLQNHSSDCAVRKHGGGDVFRYHCET